MDAINTCSYHLEFKIFGVRAGRERIGIRSVTALNSDISK